MPRTSNQHNPRFIKLKSWKVTISTKGDIPQDVVESFYRYVFRNAHIEMHYTVIERGETGRKHLHSLLCFSVGYDQAYLQNYFWRHCVKPFVDETHIGKIAVRVDINSNDTWINEYLRKEDGVEIITNEYDADRESEFYPTEREQQTLQTFVNASDAADPFYAEHSGLYAIWLRDRVRYGDLETVSTTSLAQSYFYNRMYVQKNMRIIRDKRALWAMSECLHRYLAMDDTLNFEDRKFHAGLQGPTFDFQG